MKNDRTTIYGDGVTKNNKDREKELFGNPKGILDGFFLLAI